MEIVFTGHAVQRMFERAMNQNAILEIIADGEVIAEYPDDRPYPSWLILGFAAGEAIHVVVGREQENHVCFVITTYHPDPNLWSGDFKTRRET
jgi:hypothetical protein